MRVIIIGRNYTSRLGMIRAIGETGNEVYVIVTTKGMTNIIQKYIKAPDISSRYVKKAFFAQEPDKNLLIHTLLYGCKCKSGKAVIIPVDDYAAATIDEHINVLKDFFFFPNIQLQQNAIVKEMEKTRQKQKAKEAGFLVANGCIVEVNKGKYSLPKGIKYPCFPKPEVSALGDKTIMKKCNDEKALRQAIDGFLKRKECKILIEDYMEIKKEYCLLGFCDQEIVYTPYIIWEKKLGSGNHCGVTMNGEVYPMIQSIAEKVKKLMSSLSFVGLFDIDLYETNEGVFFSELNLRFGASGYAITAMGDNLPNMLINRLSDSLIYSEMLNSVCTKEKEQHIGKEPIKEFINEKVVYEDYYNGYMNKDEYSNYMRQNASIIRFIYQNKDKKPYFLFRCACFLQRVKRRKTYR